MVGDTENRTLSSNKRKSNATFKWASTNIMIGDAGFLLELLVGISFVENQLAEDGSCGE